MKKQTKKASLLFILTVVAGLLVNWVTPIDIPGRAWIALKWIRSLVLINYPLPVWAILLLLMLALPSLVLTVLALFPRRRMEYAAVQKSYLSYVSDTFFGISWHWKYIGGQAVRR
jgi:hypothetical protein